MIIKQPGKVDRAPCFISPYQIGIEVCFSSSSSFDSDSAIPQIIKIASPKSDPSPSNAQVMWAAQRQDETERIGNGCLFWQVPSCAFPLSFAVFPTRACIHTYYPVCLSVCLSYWLLCSRQGQLSSQRAPLRTGAVVCTGSETTVTHSPWCLVGRRRAHFELVPTQPWTGETKGAALNPTNNLSPRSSCSLSRKLKPLASG